MIILKIKHPSWNNPVVQKVDSFPCSIGRSIKNSIVLSDDSISAEHAIIEKQTDGSFILKDLDSTNGILFEGKRYGQIVLRDHGHIKCGDVEISTLLGDERLEKTRVIELPKEFQTSKKKRLKRTASSCLAIVLLIVLNEFLADPLRSENWIDILLSSLISLLVLLGVSGMISVVSKVQHKKYDFLKYLDISMLFGVSYFVLLTFHDSIKFFLNNRMAINIFNLFMVFIFFYIYFSKVLYVFFDGKFKKKIDIGLIGSFVFVFAVVTLTAKFNSRNTRFVYNGSYIYTTRNFDKDSYSQLNFVDQLDKSFKTVNEYRQEKLEEKEESKKIEDSLDSE
ncbi:MAG: FHA domain-containing protein [Bacteriovoracaceae bacterium]|nr:FHA domain-containing protein [Bacteriovoracaceae bacterium]